MICQFCKQEIPKMASGHIYGCAKKHGIIQERSKTKYDYIMYNYPQFIKEFAYQIYFTEEKSLPAIKEEFGMQYDTFSWLLEYYGYKRRNSSQAASTDYVRNKFKKTCLERFGVEHNLAKGSPLLEKRNNTIKKRYGVDNPFQIQEVNKKIHSDEYYLEKFGKTYKEKKKYEMTIVWQNLSDEAKEDWLKRSIKSEKAKNTMRENSINDVFSNKISTLESRVAKLFNEINLTYTAQFIINVDKANIRLYDFYIPIANLILEINGKYWHADPRIYLPNDNMKYGKAEDVWEKDYFKMKLAISKSYKIEYLWEIDMNNMNDDELKEELIRIINNALSKNKINKENKLQ